MSTQPPPSASIVPPLPSMESIAAASSTAVKTESGKSGRKRTVSVPQVPWHKPVSSSDERHRVDYLLDYYEQVKGMSNEKIATITSMCEKKFGRQVTPAQIRGKLRALLNAKPPTGKYISTHLV
jgi:hypothetical protein